MSPSEVLSILAALVVARGLTRADAAGIYAAWQAGTITDSDIPAAPLTSTELGALTAGALLRANRRLAGVDVEPSVLRAVVTTRVDPLPFAERQRRAADLLDVFAREADRRTGVLFQLPDAEAANRRSRGDLRRWQVAMRQAVAEDIATMSRLGLGRAPSASETSALLARVTERTGYVDQLAARIASDRAGLTRPLSERQVAAALRRTLGGEARAAFYRAAVASEAREGVVVYFEGADTPNTCSPCLEAERGSPYLPGAAPLPGVVCLGGGFCKHDLRFVEDAREYARLAGARAA